MSTFSNFYVFEKTSTNQPPTPTNCREFLDKRLQVRWVMKGDMVEITLSARIREDQWMAFGLSGENDVPKMVHYNLITSIFIF